MQAIAATPVRRIPAPLVTTIVTLGAWIAHVALREGMGLEPGHPARLAATGALVAAFAVHVVVTARAMRGLDEFQKEIQLSALAFAFPVSMIAMFAIGFFRAEGMLSEMDPRDLAALMLVTYAAGIALAWRRYR